MKKLVLICFIIKVVMPLKAQEMLGLTNSNYSGLSGIIMNPASMADSKLYMDINFIKGNVFYQSNLKNNAYGNFRLDGPAFMLNKGRHAFAISDAARTVVSFKTLSQLRATTGVKAPDMYKVGGLAWGEVGFSYAYIFKRMEKNVWAAGITLKMLAGAGGAYFSSSNNAYTFNSSIAENLNNGGFSSGGSLGYGKGFGIDLGVVYQKKKKPVNLITLGKLCNQKFQLYDYKVGISLIDIGSIKFSGSSANSNFNKNLILSYGGIDTSKFLIADDTTYKYSSSSINMNSFNMSLPSAVSLQFDYYYKKNIYANFTLIYGISSSNTSVKRPSLIAFTPRFEKRWFEAGVPVSVSDFKYFRLGLFLRLWNFSIGTDNLLGSLGAGTNKSFDVYFSLKMNFAKGRCGRKHGQSILNPFKQLFI